MTGVGRPAGSLGAVLDEQRLGRFVGRRAELELFDVALEGADPPFAVLHVHGPGGIGKSCLLDAFAARAAEAGAEVVRVDGGDIVPTSAGVRSALASSVELGDDDSPALVPTGRRLVVLIDAYEQLVGVDDWVRTGLLPRLPASSVVVLVGREAPRSPWRMDLAWDELLRVVSLRNLDRRECERYLELRHIDPDLHGRLIEASHGHPLGLSLLCDVVTHGGPLTVDPLTPELVSTLVGEFVAAVPDRSRRRALEACAITRVTTESLLRAIPDLDDGHAAFAWLRELSFVEAEPDGVVPHELARDTLDRDVRWRDPDAYRVVFRAIRDHICERLKATRGADQLRAIFDLKYLFRNMPSVLSPVDWSQWGRHYPEPARPADRATVIQLIAETEGPRSAELVRRWWSSQPDAFHVVRDDDGGVRGVIVLLDLTRASDDERAADPGTHAAWEHAQRHAPPRPGETVTMTRFVEDRQAHQGPSPTLNAVPIITLQRYLNMRNLALDYLALFEPEPWDEYFRTADLPRAEGADFRVDARRSGLFCHDFRRVPVDELIMLWTERALAQDPTLQTDISSASTIVLSHAEFRHATREALKTMHHHDRLAANPLARTRLVQESARAADADEADALGSLLADAVDSLRHDPRDERQLRALDRTYVRPAPSQEAAAEVLDLPFSTYRRHLTQGVDRVADWLWEREIYGPQT